MKMLVHVLLIVVVIVTLSLSDAVPDHHHHHPQTIKSNAVTNVSFSDAAVHPSRHFSEDVDHASRQRRQAQPLTPQQIREIVDIHNVLRAREGANNMERMTWNDFLASTAAGWAAGCNWKHGQPPLGDNPTYTSMGQNLYATTGSVMNLTAAIQHGWYDEKQYYDYDTQGCSHVCGHYTAVVWATSRHVGCGYHLCESLAGSGFTEALYLVCNYGPPGNYAGLKPYTKGPACSKCGSGAGWCKDGLCNGDCSAPGDDCQCASHCYNCAQWSSRTCRCSCANGWHGVDCSVPCKDTHSHCNANPGWPPSLCGREYVRSNCPAMCARCTPDPNAVADRCPPIYGPYAHQSAQTMFTKKQQATILLTIVIALSIVSDVITL